MARLSCRASAAHKSRFSRTRNGTAVIVKPGGLSQLEKTCSLISENSSNLIQTIKLMIEMGTSIVEMYVRVLKQV